MIHNIFILIFAVTILSCNTNKSTSVERDSTTDNTTATMERTEEQRETPQQVQQQTQTGPLVTISTSYGDMKARLYDATPQHRDNFLKLAKEGFYNELLFHRVIQGFMIQGGDPDSKNAKPGQQLGTGGPGYTVPAEINQNFFHKKGALSAARQADQVNPQRASSGSQFYIVQGKTYTDQELDQMERQMSYRFSPEQREAYKTIGGTPFLDGSYTVFGEVTEGLGVIDQIAAQPTAPGDRPQQDIKFSIKVD